MTDDLERLRRLRPDGVLGDEPPDIDVLAAGRHRLLADTIGAVSPDPLPTPTLYPRLAYRDERAALEFLTRAFGLVERREARLEHADGMLAWLQLGTGVVMIGRAGPDHHGLESPVTTGAPTMMVQVSVEDADAHHERARSAGARVLAPPEDMFWGDRCYEALDLEGHRWFFAQRRLRATGEVVTPS